MNSFIKALQSKMRVLADEKERHRLAIESIDAKLELLDELCRGEGDDSDSVDVSVPKKRGRGRPKGSTKKNKKKTSSAYAVDDDLYQEAIENMKGSESTGTSKEFQKERIARFNPQARPARELGPGIVAGTKKEVKAAGKQTPDSVISIEEDE